MSLAVQPALADGPQQRMFPGPESCYQREYGPEHLSAHPAQRVVEIALIQSTEGVPSGMLGLWVRLTLRNSPAGQRLDAMAYCEAAGAAKLSCLMEGDAGSFVVAAVDDTSVRLDVGSAGMGFEGETGFDTLAADSGDDRSFILHAATCR
jgi:hypothetical protein